MGKIRYVIVDLDDDGEYDIKRLIKAKVVSAVISNDTAIVARYGVNKTTLKKILAKKEGE